MTRVSLLGTVHEEQGLATIPALHEILESVRPEVIFLEVPPADFPAYRDGTRSNLESSAARRYAEAQSAVIVPVDLPTPEASFFRDAQYMDRRIAATSPTYRQLVDRNARDIATYGFPYLCSKKSSDVWSSIYETMEVAVRRLSHDTRLTAILETWRRTNNLRERGMLMNIIECAHRDEFVRGVLLVGAAHVQPIIDMWQEGGAAGALRIERGQVDAPS